MHFLLTSFRKSYCCALLATLVLATTACTSDQLPKPTAAECGDTTPTYTQDVRPIIEASCAYSGCHLDSSPGRFDSYNGLLLYLDDNTFRQRVIVNRSDATIGMPPDFAPITDPKT